MPKTSEKVAERVILVGVAGPETTRWEANDYLDELELLADTAGGEVVGRMVQERRRIDPAYFIGKGKAQSLKERAGALQANVIIFDEDLSPAQARNLEKLLDRKVIDRSALILDIFARRAKTREARTQVELAQLRYLLPRLTRQWTHLSRQVGGIGTRGPGETQLEVDRRMIRKRIAGLERDLAKIEKQRELRRKHRTDVFKVALVGYTNVGKSTLLNALTQSDVFIEDRLFATLDATVRSLEIDQNTTLLLIDTVGFIRKLPHHLVASFKSTLEEAQDADLLLHVIDLTHPQFEDQIATVNDVLKDLGLLDKQLIYVFNKVDALENQTLVNAMRARHEPAVFISAARGMFLGELRDSLVAAMRANEAEFKLIIDAADGNGAASVYEYATVLDRAIVEDKIHFTIRTSKEKAARLKARLHARDPVVEFVSH